MGLTVYFTYLFYNFARSLRIASTGCLPPNSTATGTGKLGLSLIAECMTESLQQRVKWFGYPDSGKQWYSASDGGLNFEKAPARQTVDP